MSTKDARASRVRLLTGSLPSCATIAGVVALLRLLGLVMLAACFSPTYREGSPCGDLQPCPSALTCDPVSKTCVRLPMALPPDGPDECAPGFSFDGSACVDVDECATATHDCGASATCTNQPGSFSCACDPGYAGDGRTCSRVCSTALIFDDCPAPGTSCETIPEATFSDDAAEGLGISVRYGGVADEAAFGTLFDAGGFELLIFESSRVAIDQVTADRVASWVAGGGKAIIFFWNLDNATTGLTIRTALGVNTVADLTAPRDVHRDPTSVVNVFDRLEQVTSPLAFVNVMADDGDELALAGAGTIAARHTSATGPGAIAITRNDRAITLGFLPLGLVAQGPRDADGDGKPDVAELYTNLIGYLCGF